MDFADWFWIIWAATGLVFFEVGAAIFRPRWTLSFHIWKWFGVRRLIDRTRANYSILLDEVEFDEGKTTPFGHRVSLFLDSFLRAVYYEWDIHYALLRWTILLGLCLSIALHFLFMTPSLFIVIFAVGAAWSVFYHYKYEAQV